MGFSCIFNDFVQTLQISWVIKREFLTGFSWLFLWVFTHEKTLNLGHEKAMKNT